MHKYVLNSQDLDYTPYWSLIEHDLHDFMPSADLPQEQREAPINLTQDENTVQILVEEISEELKRESEEDLKGNKESTMLFGYDVGAMSTMMKLGYLVSVLIFFGLIFHFLTSSLMETDKADPIKKRREEILKRKNK